MKLFGIMLVSLLLFFEAITVFGKTSDEIVEQIRENLSGEFNEIPAEYESGNSLEWEDRSFSDDSAVVILSHHFFRSIKDSTVKDYGRMIARIAIGRYFCVDSVLCNSRLEKFMSNREINFDELIHEGKTKIGKTPIFILISLPEEIIIITGRCEDLNWFFNWREYAKVVLSNVCPISNGKVYISYCGGPVEIVTEDYFSEKK